MTAVRVCQNCGRSRRSTSPLCWDCYKHGQELASQRLFWTYVRVDGDCWTWTGSFDRDGYARIHKTPAYRRAYELAVGAIPAGMDIDHLCRNRACVNPKHLEAVTPEENRRRANLQVRTHCVKRLHLLPPKRIGIKRECAECRRARERARHQEYVA